MNRNQIIERGLLAQACRENAVNDEQAAMDIELIENLLSYQKVHILQPRYTASGRKTKAFRTLVDMCELIIEANLVERKELNVPA